MKLLACRVASVLVAISLLIAPASAFADGSQVSPSEPQLHPEGPEQPAAPPEVPPVP
jgi:hypothetical protein